MLTKTVRWLALGLIMALVVAACGSAREPLADVVAGTPTPTEEATATEGGEDTESAEGGEDTDAAEEDTPAEPETESAEGGEDTDEAAPEADLPMFGDEPWPCGPGDASGETQQGVTDETITIGVGDDRGFPSNPGLNKEMTDAVLALVEVCNGLGGINGRMIETNIYDAAIFMAGQVILEACDQVFMLVGTGWSLDSGSEPDRVACGMAAVPGFTVSADFAHGPDALQAVPNPADQQNYGHGWIMENIVAEELGLDVTNSAAMYANYAATEETWEKIRESWPGNTGFEFPTEVVYNVQGEDDWTPFALQLKSAGSEVIYYTGTCFPNYQGVRQAAAVNDYEAVWTMENNFYGVECANANTDGAMDGTYVRTSYVPFEEAEFSQAMTDYLGILEDAGVVPSFLGTQASSSFMLWATAAAECGSDLTSDCVLEAIDGIDAWTGHGLHVPTDPSENQMVRCLALLVLEGTEWSRVYPEEPASFACPEDVGDDEWVVTIETAASEAALLDENRVSTKYTGG